MKRPYSPSVDKNKEPILEVLKKYITKKTQLLEIGSGTGQHAIYFAEYFKDVKWTTSDIKEKHNGIKAWLKEANLKNTLGPETLKIGQDDFPKRSFDYVFTANTLHIMSWKENKTFFKLLGKRLREGSLVFFYGPFNYQGQYISSGNEILDKNIKEENSLSGIRNFEEILASMENFGFKLLKDHEMPVNNRLLVFERLPFSIKK